MSGVLFDECLLICAIKPKECLHKTLDVFCSDYKGNLLQVDLPEFISDLPTHLSETNVGSIAGPKCLIGLSCLSSKVVNAVTDLLNVELGCGVPLTMV